jgi:hypothetical protein
VIPIHFTEPTLHGNTKFIVVGAHSDVREIEGSSANKLWCPVNGENDEAKLANFLDQIIANILNVGTCIAHVTSSLLSPLIRKYFKIISCDKVRKEPYPRIWSKV